MTQRHSSGWRPHLRISEEATTHPRFDRLQKRCLTRAVGTDDQVYVAKVKLPAVNLLSEPFGDVGEAEQFGHRVDDFGRGDADVCRDHGLVEQLPDLSRRELVDGVHQLFLTERIDGERSEDDVPNHELVAV